MLKLIYGDPVSQFLKHFVLVTGILSDVYDMPRAPRPHVAPRSLLSPPSTLSRCVAACRRSSFQYAPISRPKAPRCVVLPFPRARNTNCAQCYIIPVEWASISLCKKGRNAKKPRLKGGRINENG